jgi:hypothetical protein
MVAQVARAGLNGVPGLRAHGRLERALGSRGLRRHEFSASYRAHAARRASRRHAPLHECSAPTTLTAGRRSAPPLQPAGPASYRALAMAVERPFEDHLFACPWSSEPCTQHAPPDDDRGFTLRLKGSPWIATAPPQYLENDKTRIGLPPLSTHFLENLQAFCGRAQRPETRGQRRGATVPPMRYWHMNCLTTPTPTDRPASSGGNT